MKVSSSFRSIVLHTWYDVRPAVKAGGETYSRIRVLRKYKSGLSAQGIPHGGTAEKEIVLFSNSLRTAKFVPCVVPLEKRRAK